MGTLPLVPTQAHIEHIREQGLILLSPHLDDVAFSIGHLVQKIGTGVLVNVFGRSLHLARLPTGPSQPLTELDVSAIRHAEDERFARLCGLARVDLGLPGPELLGRRPNDGAHLLTDVAAALPRITETLAAMRVPGKRPFVWGPLGVGRHVNHTATHRVLEKLPADLRANFRWGYYEDLPYAHDPFARAMRVRQIAANSAGLQRYAHRCSWESKRALVSIYSSQLRREPSAYQFRPAAHWPVGIHEALWMAPCDGPGGAPC